MKIGIASDHAGFLCKQELYNYLISKKYEIKDYGTHDEKSVDYPDFAHSIALAVSNKQIEYGILVCGTGNGVAMSANKHNSIRAALCWNDNIAFLARSHNNANILCIPGRFVEMDLVKKMTDIFLTTKFEGGRHEARVRKVSF